MKKIYNIFLVCFLFVSTVQNIQSQTNTMYYMGTTPQSYYLNPATQPQCNFYLGMPVLSSFQYTVLNSGFTYSDVLKYNSLEDLWLTPFSSTNVADEFLDGLNNVEYFRGDVSFNLASFGFRAGKMYFNFDASIKNSVYFSYPKDLLDFAINGNDNDQNFDFSSFNTEVLSYTEFGVNISRTFGDQLTLGIRPKLLYGLATANMQFEEFSMNTSTEEWVVDIQGSGSVAATGVTIPVDEEGIIDFEEDPEFDTTIVDNPGENWNKVFSKNRGLGIDFGLHYTPSDDVQLSVSLIDLGYIKWAENPQVITAEGTYSFLGVQRSFSDTSDWELAQTLLDSLDESIPIEGNPETFTSHLSPKLMIGGRFFVTPGLDVGALATTSFYNDKINQDLALLANLHPVNWFSLSASYNVLGKTRTSFGLGLGLKFWIFNLYAVGDFLPMQYDMLDGEDLPIKIPIPADKYNFNLRFGLNLAFGCNKEKKLQRDKPMLNSNNWMF